MLAELLPFSFMGPQILRDCLYQTAGVRQKLIHFVHLLTIKNDDPFPLGWPDPGSQAPGIKEQRDQAWTTPSLSPSPPALVLST